MARVAQKQPQLLAGGEIARLFASYSHPVHRMVLQTMYATGLRVSEACALRVNDIDSHSDRMCIHVACGKGGHATGSTTRAGTDIAHSAVHGPRTPGCGAGWPRCWRCRTRTWSSHCHTV